MLWIHKITSVIIIKLRKVYCNVLEKCVKIYDLSSFFTVKLPANRMFEFYVVTVQVL